MKGVLFYMFTFYSNLTFYSIVAFSVAFSLLIIFYVFTLCLLRFLPLLDMLQEIHFKIMNRIRINRESMEQSDLQICSRIKKKLDIAVTQSRDWRATWDGLRSFVVCSGILFQSVNCGHAYYLD